MALFRPDFDNAVYSRTGAHLTELAFPLGGIATGCVSLDGRGALRDWEIFGQPNKGSWLDYTFPSLWTKAADGATQACTVLGLRLKNWVGEGREFWAYGHGQFFRTMDGLPGFDRVEFTGTFPVARLRFEKESSPLEVELAAFNPFIPHDVRSSSFPAAELVYRLTNRTDAPVEYCLAWSVKNPVGNEAPEPEKDQARNTWTEEEGLKGFVFSNARYSEDDVRAGEFVVATTHPDVIHLDRWSDEGWWDSVRAFWNRFRLDGSFGPGKESSSGARMPASLGCRGTLQPGESVEIPFTFAWRFPTAQKIWRESEPRWKAHYGTVWPSAWSVAKELTERREELTRRTLAFESALYGGSFGPEVLESVGATLSTLHTPTIIRLEDGSFWAWEGCSPGEGCCEGTCSHVWNYAVAHAHLFPEIQASFLDSALQHGFNCGPQGEEGAMRFRIPIPMASQTDLWHAASDGQLGQIVQGYRDWRLTGDEDALRRRWPALKRGLSFAWVMWDRDRDGLVEGDMHNTYDINFQGPNPLTQFFYLAALRAMERIADHLGDPVKETYRDLADRGTTLTKERLWNGEYFFQLGDFTDESAARYQHGPGCLTDQLFGQLSASLAGLGHLVDADLIRKALGSIVQHNFRSRLGNHENLQRTYVFPDEGGLLLCTWPEGGMPFYPFVYSDEVWTGIEYQVATHLAVEGMESESRDILRAIRSRHDGVRRNPWNEYECGSHYARALASYGLLIALSGMRYDAVEGTLSFRETPFRSFWSIPGSATGGAWGIAERREDGSLHFEVLEGKIPPEVKFQK
jgi:non-lysosomal glucosylceramidase